MYTQADNADIFIHTNQSIEEIALSLAQLLQLKVKEPSRRTILGKDYDIYVRINKGCARYGEPIYFPNFRDFCYYLEYAPQEDLEEKISIEVVTKILEFFWNKNIPAVAACGYAEALPLNGGEDEKAPWPN